MNDTALLGTLAPVIAFLGLGVGVMLLSRALRISPIVGYILLGLGLRAAGATGWTQGWVHAWLEHGTVETLAQLGVVFLLFDIGLHFSLDHLRQHAADIFAFGPMQVIAATALLGLAAVALGLPPAPALLLGTILSLSSTAVVGRIIAERHQQGCPVGLTATSVLVFQDVAAILLLVVAGALAHGGSVAAASALALGKAVAAFAVTFAASRLLVGRVLALVARNGNEEIFTAIALLIALAAAYATGSVGLSLTLGAFLGGQALAATPYRYVIEYEIKPFRALLLGFFFISIGLSLDTALLLRAWPAIIGLTLLMLAVKIAGNMVASLVFRWSVPGSVQLGFLLGQGSEFAFIILALPATQALVGPNRAAMAVAVVTTTIALTPNLAEAGRRLAGALRHRASRRAEQELIPSSVDAPVIIVGMGTIGRAVADALIRFGVDYYGLERDEQRLRTATADGYNVGFGDGSDARLWSAVGLGTRKISVLTAPDPARLEVNRTALRAISPTLRRFAHARDPAEAAMLDRLDVVAITDADVLPGLALARAVLAAAAVPAPEIERWARERRRLVPPAGVLAGVEDAREERAWAAMP